MQTFRKAGRSFTKTPTEAETAWLKKANYILAKHNIIPSQAVPRHITLPDYPTVTSGSVAGFTAAQASRVSRVSRASRGSSNITLPTTTLGDAKFESLINDCDRLLDDSPVGNLQPAATHMEHQTRLAMATKAAAVVPRMSATPTPTPTPKVVLDAKSESSEDTVSLQFKELVLRPPAQVQTYDADQSFHTNMTKCWEAIPVQKRSHMITFVPTGDHQEFAGKDRQGIFERFSINEEGISDMKNFLDATSATVAAIDASSIEMLNGDIYDAEHDLIVNNDDDLLSTASHMLRSSYPQHHFEELVQTFD